MIFPTPTAPSDLEQVLISSLSSEQLEALAVLAIVKARAQARRARNCFMAFFGNDAGSGFLGCLFIALNLGARVVSL